MRSALVVVAVSALFCVGAAKLQTAPAFTFPTCLQDQYGNQYDSLVLDTKHQVITGTAINNQGCAPEWPIVGTWSVDGNGNRIVEISSANPTPASGCQSMYTLRGAYPQASWYYPRGFGGQTFTFTGCSAKAALPQDLGVGGSHGPA